MARSRSHGRTSKKERREKRRREAIAAHPRRLAHETMTILAPPWAKAVRGLAERMQPAPGADPILVEERHLAGDGNLDSAVRSRFLMETELLGWDRELALANAQCLFTMAECAINYEIGGRKAFWVDGGLAELRADDTRHLGRRAEAPVSELRIPVR